MESTTLLIWRKEMHVEGHEKSLKCSDSNKEDNLNNITLQLEETFSEGK